MASDQTPPGLTRQTVCRIEAGGYNPTLNLCIAVRETLDKPQTAYSGRSIAEVSAGMTAAGLS